MENLVVRGIRPRGTQIQTHTTKIVSLHSPDGKTTKEAFSVPCYIVECCECNILYFI